MRRQTKIRNKHMYNGNLKFEIRRMKLKELGLIILDKLNTIQEKDKKIETTKVQS